MTATAEIADPDTARTQLRLAVLRQWIEAGLALARRMSEGPRRSLIEGTLTLLRITQAVRLALVLIARLSDPDSLFHSAPAKPRPSRADAPEARTEKAPDDSRTPGESLRFAGEPVSDAAILRRPLVEIVKVICAALGVTPDWSLWSDDADADPEATAPTPRPGRAAAAPAPRPRPGLIPIPPARPAAAERLLSRLRRSCSPLALIPIVAPASGRPRLFEA